LAGTHDFFVYFIGSAKPKRWLYSLSRLTCGADMQLIVFLSEPSLGFLEHAEANSRPADPSGRRRQAGNRQRGLTTQGVVRWCEQPVDRPSGRAKNESGLRKAGQGEGQFH